MAGNKEVKFGMKGRDQEKEVIQEKWMTQEEKVAREKQEYYGAQGELSFSTERWQSLRGDHPKCQEGFLVLQVLNYKSHVGWDFGKGP